MSTCASGRLFFTLLYSLTLLGSAVTARAGWLSDGVPVCTAPGDQLTVVGCDDGQEGLLLAWRDLRPGGQGIYVQRISPGGSMLWTTNGVLVSTPGSGPSHPSIAPDGSGGAWIVWNDWINPDASVVLQHLDATGAPAWAPPGGSVIRDGTGFFSPLRPVCTRDGSGGVIVAWAEETSPRGGPLVAQRFDAGGTALWAAPGVVVGDSILAGAEIDIVPHGQGDGGAALGWVAPFGASLVSQGRAQYVAADGTPQWNGSFGRGLGQVVDGSRVRMGERHRFDNGAYVLYQRSFSSPPGPTREWRVIALAENQYEWWSNSVGGGNDLGLDASIIAAENGGCVVAWYGVSSTTDMLTVSARHFAGQGGSTVWEQILGIDPAPITAVRPAAVYDGSYFGYRFAWPAVVDGTTRLHWRSMGRNGEAIPDPGAGVISGSICSRTPAISPGPQYTSPVLLGWRDERPVTHTDVYATALAYDGRNPSADLTFRSFRSDPDPAIVGSPRNLRAVMLNTGLADADGFSVAYWHDVPTPTGSPDQEWTYYSGLAAGDSIILEFVDPFVATTPQTWHSWMRVDFEGDVDEGPYEDDNDRELVVDWVARANLLPTLFQISPADPVVGELARYRVSVRNDGSAPTGPFEVHIYRDRLAAPSVGDAGDEIHVVTSLAPGGTALIPTISFTHDRAQRWTSYVLVDALGSVDESDEADNDSGPLGVTWSVPSQTGWPVDAGTGILSSPVIATLPTEPRGLRAVLVTSTDGRCYAWDGLGRVLPGWPYSGGDPIRSSPAVADIDGDGLAEVVFGDDAGIVHCLDHAGHAQWTYDAQAAVTATPVVGEIHPGISSTGEVLFGDAAGKLHLVDAFGNPVPGWPVDLGDQIVASPAVGNLDGIGLLEIVAIALSSKPAGSTIHVLTPYGVTVGAPWPLHLGSDVYASPALGDIGGDSRLEIVVGDTSGWLRVWTLAVAAPAIEVDLGAPIHAAISLADLDDDPLGKCEIVAVTDVFVPVQPFGGYWKSMVWALDNTGSPRTGWPAEVRKGLSDCRGGDGSVVWGESKRAIVAVGSEVGESFVFDSFGVRLDGTSMPVTGSIGGSLAIGELDADGHLEVVVAGEGEVACYDYLAGSYRPDRMQWPMFGHDPERTHCLELGAVTSIRPTAPPPAFARWLEPRPNPFNPAVTLPFELSTGGSVEVVLYDVAGRVVRRMAWERLEAGTHRPVWNGRDQKGDSVASGVYLVELRFGGDRDRTRVVLLR